MKELSGVAKISCAVSRVSSWAMILVTVAISMTASGFLMAQPRIQRSRRLRQVGQQLNRQFIPGIDLDSWTNVLVHPSGTESPTSFSLPTEGQILLDKREPRAIFADLLARLKKIKLIGANDEESAQNYANLARRFEEMRQWYRYDLKIPILQKRRVLYLMQILAEEIMYVGSKKYPTQFPPVIRVSQLDPQAAELAEKNPRAATFVGYRVLTGDVILSKAVGDGSSELIAFLMRSRHIFSHVTVADVDPQTHSLMSPEALIQDGLKLRWIDSEYDPKPPKEPTKSRIFIYRLVASPQTENQVSNAVAEGVDRFVSWMYSRVKDPFQEAAAPYDHSMNPFKQNQFICTTTVWNIYNRVKAILQSQAGTRNIKYDVDFFRDDINGYAEPYWSDVNPRNALLVKALGVKRISIPAPGDLEVDPNFELVGSVVNVSTLPQERIEAAIVDYILNFFGSRRVQEVLGFLAKLRQVNWTPQEMAALEKADVLPAAALKKMQAISRQIPPGMSVNQVTFFYFLDNVFTPKIRAMVTAQVGSKIIGFDSLYSLVAGDVNAVWKNTVRKFAGIHQLNDCSAVLQH